MNGAVRKVKVKLMNCLCDGNKNMDRNPALPDMQEKTGRHPCYSYGAHHRYARMHLPVAPMCNICCNYCNRQYDCLHESRPGVTSEVLTPQLALQKFKMVKKKIENLSVVGIAGPGDALANWGSTCETLKLIRRDDPEIIFCLSTNGLMLPHRSREIFQLGVRHVTVTVNCIDPDVGQKIYRHVRYQGKKYEGAEGAGLLIENQMTGIKDLVRYGAVVKVNIVMIRGINDFHIPEIVKKLKGLGVYITNIMPLIPARGSLFENYPRTGMQELNKMRGICQADLRQMRHCRQCRADAIGLLDNDRSSEFRMAAPERELSGLTDSERKARAV